VDFGALNKLFVNHKKSNENSQNKIFLAIECHIVGFIISIIRPNPDGYLGLVCVGSFIVGKPRSATFQNLFIESVFIKHRFLFG